ncbi:MAG: hypothetical protein ACRC62_20695 [Microcoleus sp.]
MSAISSWKIIGLAGLSAIALLAPTAYFALPNFTQESAYQKLLKEGAKKSQIAANNRAGKKEPGEDADPGQIEAIEQQEYKGEYENSAQAAAPEVRFVDPRTFANTPEERQMVVDYITADTYHRYTRIGMGDPSTLRAMERENLASFRKLAAAKDPQLLGEVVNRYCQIDMCDYHTIWMMYHKELSDKADSLQW